MSIASFMYHRLPAPVKPYARHLYNRVFVTSSEAELHREFANRFFEDTETYNSLTEGFASRLEDHANHQGLYNLLTSNSGLGGVSIRTCEYQYALVRALEPATIVETGVCNGLSTLAILLALKDNGQGQLYSIDYPLRAEETLEDFLAHADISPEEFYDEIAAKYDHAMIPGNRDPGWIVPNRVQEFWTLREAKSQRELPRLAVELDDFDLFIHDSDHSLGCMLFEYELAWEYLRPGGLLVSDDINLTSAFETFTEGRNASHGRLPNNIGYVKKPRTE